MRRSMLWLVSVLIAPVVSGCAMFEDPWAEVDARLATQAAEATAIPTPDALATAEAAAAVCDHPYQPLVAGAEWTYGAESAIGDGEMTLRVVAVSGNRAEITSSRDGIDGPITGTGTEVCGPNGNYAERSSTDVAAGADRDFVIELKESQGVDLLPADGLVPGATWDTHIVASQTRKADGMKVIEELDSHMTVLEPVRVTVPAGTFEALVIRTESVSRQRVIDLSLQFPTVRETELTYLVRGVGRVKSESSGTLDTDGNVSLDIWNKMADGVREKSATVLLRYTIPSSPSPGAEAVAERSPKAADAAR